VSWPRKRPAPIVGKLPDVVEDEGDFVRRREIIVRLWSEATQSPPDLSDADADRLVWEISSCVPQPAKPADGAEEAVREAIVRVLNWNRETAGRPEVGRVQHLESLLVLALDLVGATQSREWVNRAWAIWGLTGRILKRAGRAAGTGPSSHAIRFTSLALQWVGYPAATADAVAKVIQRDPDFRKRMLA